MSRVESALKAADLPPLAWYEVLVELERAGAYGVRPFALEEALQLPQYGLSRLLARMEAAGLVLRGSCPGDGRGQMVVAHRCRARDAPAHVAGLCGGGAAGGGRAALAGRGRRARRSARPADRPAGRRRRSALTAPAAACHSGRPGRGQP